MSKASHRGVHGIVATGVVVLGALLAGRASAAIRFLQAESATINNGRIESASTRYTGPAYVNPDDRVGSGITWTVDIAALQPVSAVVKFRYANGISGKKKAMAMILRVNGAAAGRLEFPGTGGWSTWTMTSTPLTLAPGTQVIQLTSDTTSGGPLIDRLDLDDGQGTPTDWTSILVESTMARYPSAANLGSWTYYRALFLRGVLALHQRTGDQRYFNYVRAWVDAHVNSSGVIDAPLDKLDAFMPGHLLLSLYAATGAAKYKIAADQIRARFRTDVSNPYPRLSDGALQHKAGTSEVTPSQIWIDGVYMANPFLIRYGAMFGESAYASDEATGQLLKYASHTQDPVTGLLYHGFDESRQASWSDPATGRSPEFWCRAMGWYGMAVIDVLEGIPADHPSVPALIAIVQNLIAGLVAYQDPTTGRWYQVVNKGSLSGNWLETSCGSMHTYVISRAVERGYVPSTYLPAAQKGLQGTLAKIAIAADGLTSLQTICVGTAVGNLGYYLSRPTETNDMHGLGAFILMFEQMNR